MGRCTDTRQRLLCAVRELFWAQSYGATTVDAICAKAKVLKGSFYHFFDSKTDLAIAAVREDREARRRNLDSVFSPIKPPLERIGDYARFLHSSQVQLKKDCGHVYGCPLFTLGAEIGTQEPKLRVEIHALLEDNVRYLESAIREAQTKGELPAGDAGTKARCLHYFFEGALTQARIANDPALLKELPAQALALLRSEIGQSAA